VVGENRPVATGSNSVPLDQVLVQNYRELLGTPAVTHRVANRLHMPAGELAGKMSFGVVTGTYLINVTAADRQPGRAAEVANAYATTFVTMNQRAAGSRDATRLSSLNQDIANLRDALAQYFGGRYSRAQTAELPADVIPQQHGSGVGRRIPGRHDHEPRSPCGHKAQRGVGAAGHQSAPWCESRRARGSPTRSSRRRRSTAAALERTIRSPALQRITENGDLLALPQLLDGLHEVEPSTERPAVVVAEPADGAGEPVTGQEDQVQVDLRRLVVPGVPGVRLPIPRRFPHAVVGLRRAPRLIVTRG